MNWLVHGFSTRFGGVSRGIYSSMNLSFTRGDEESCVKENYRRISDAMGFDMNSIVTSDQTHTNNVRKVTEKDRGKGIVIPRDYTDTDGMITNVPGLVLATFMRIAFHCILLIRRITRSDCLIRDGEVRFRKSVQLP